MPALIPTDFYATITWLGRVPNRDTPELVTETLDQMPLGFEGMEGEYHAGLTRPSCARVTSQHPIGTTIRNTRQISIVSEENLTEIAANMGADALDPSWLGASVVLKGIPDFSHIPPSSRLQTDSGTTLVVDMQNNPCQFPAMTIEAARPGEGKSFKGAAKGLRGVTAWVERIGALALNERVRLHVPAQRHWAPA